MGLDSSQMSAATLTAPEPALRPAPARLGYVDGLRALAALYVMIGHISETVWLKGPPLDTLIGVTAEPFSYGYGHFAVSVFIVLSGFSLMLPVARNGYRLPFGAWGFYWRRARRILPPYYCAMFLSLLLISFLLGQPMGTLWNDSIPVTTRGIVVHLLLVQDFSATDHVTINYVFWSIALECQIYLLFPALVALWRRYHPLFVTLLGVALSFVLALLLLPTPVAHLPGYMDDAFAPQYIGLFGLGMYAAGVYTRRRDILASRRIWLLWGGLLAAYCALMIITFPNRYIFALDMATGVMTVGILLAGAHHGAGWRNPIRAILEWRPLVWIGGFSYSLYLIHAPLIQLLWQYFVHPLGLGDTATYLALLLVGGPLIVLAAWGFWWLCERPFLNSRAATAWPGWRRQGLARDVEAGSAPTR